MDSMMAPAWWRQVVWYPQAPMKPQSPLCFFAGGKPLESGFVWFWFNGCQRKHQTTAKKCSGHMHQICSSLKKLEQPKTVPFFSWKSVGSGKAPGSHIAGLRCPRHVLPRSQHARWPGSEMVQWGLHWGWRFLQPKIWKYHEISRSDHPSSNWSFTYPLVN